MKILEKEIEFDFYNLEMMEKFEKYAEKTSNQLTSIDFKNLKQTDFIKRICEIIEECFDGIWGPGTSNMIFKGKKDFRLCIKAFKDLVRARKEQEELVSQEIEDLQRELTEASVKYSPSRATRRNK